MTMRNSSWTLLTATILSACTLALSACTIEEGNFDWDGSLFDDAGNKRDASDSDSGDDDDAGVMVKDAGKDAGKDASTMLDATMPADTGAADAGRPLTTSDVAAVLARGRCGALEACLGKSLLLASYDGNDCVDFTTRQQADRHLHWLADSVTAGRVTFRPDELAQCEKDLVKLGCDVASKRLPASCEQAVQGNRNLDADCSIDQDCKDNAYCFKGTLETCPGTCSALQTSGLPCAASQECADGLVCRGGSCNDPLAEGDTCSRRKGNDCPPGLVCQGKDGMLTCQSLETLYVGKAGDACDLYGKLCENGLVCQSQTSANTMGKCAPLADKNGTCRLAEPAQCPNTQYCKDSNANTTARATPGKDGVCADLPTEAHACIGISTQSGQPPCPVGSVCCAPGTVCVDEASTPMCHALKMAGSACSTNAECYGGLCQGDVCAITTIECK
jgi:hypothetical protein